MKRFLSILFFILPSVFLLPLPRAVFAATITPLILEVEAEPGQTVQRFVAVYNETDSDLYLSAGVETFEPRGERGEVRLLSPELSGAATGWVKLADNSLVLKPNQTAQVPVIFAIPKIADVGGYYLAVMWQFGGAPQRLGSQVNLAGRVGTLVLLTVKGEVKEDLALKEFKLSADNWRAPFWPWLDSLLIKNQVLNSSQVDFFSRLENLGSVHLKPQGYIIIKNIFGRVVASLPFNSENGNILPQSIRSWAGSWSPPNVFSGRWAVLNNLFSWRGGFYQAQLKLEYGENRKILSSMTLSFWLLPLKFLLLVGGVVILILLMIILRFRRMIKSKKITANQIPKS